MSSDTEAGLNSDITWKFGCKVSLTFPKSKSKNSCANFETVYANVNRRKLAANVLLRKFEETVFLYLL